MFEILEHTADIGFRAHGRTLEEVFESAAEALMFIAVDPAGIESRDATSIQAEGEDVEALLVNFLSDVLFVWDARRFAMRRFRVLELTPDRVRAEAQGEPFDPARHNAKLIVKAVTYHQLHIHQDEHGWRAEVYLDV